MATSFATSKAVTVFCLATSSSLFELICTNLAASNIDLSQAHVVLLEKLLGHELPVFARDQRNDTVARVFAEVW